MLTELRVRDLGVIQDLTLRLGPGMTVLTGETGAGKTLLVQALQLVLGGRASTGLVRRGSPETVVEARFVSGSEETFLARSVPPTGRSRAWIDGRMASLSALVDAGAGLVDIHGQHDQQTLLATPGQRAALDQFAGTDPGPLARAERGLADVTRRLAELGGDERERARLADLLRYQIAEIEAARICDPDEDETLATEEARLADIGELRRAAAQAASLLDESDGTTSSVTEQLGLAVTALSGRRPLGDWEQRLRGALAELGDIAGDLRAVGETWEDDPARLEEVQARRRLLAELRRKYGSTLDEVSGFKERARRELEELEGRELQAVELEGRRASSAEAIALAEEELRRLRTAAAPRLAAAVSERLRELAMPGARFEVTVGTVGAGDDVQFLIGANRGESLLALNRVASGGELARTMLALRLVVEGGAPTMLFDEVDAGVGGAAALTLARSLREVAATRQVLVVTHLPQVAASADHQIVVQKAVEGNRTFATAHPLDTEGRIVELSRMLSGHPDSATARAHAEELLFSAQSSATSATSTTSGSRRD